jgi:hypothetical protein
MTYFSDEQLKAVRESEDDQLVAVGQLREALASLLAVLGHSEGCGAYTAPCACWQRRPVGLAVAALRETGGLPDWLEGYEHGDD